MIPNKDTYLCLLSLSISTRHQEAPLNQAAASNTLKYCDEFSAALRTRSSTATSSAPPYETTGLRLNNTAIPR